MDNKLRKEYVKLHISVVLAAFTGILGKLINLNAVLLVWYRMFLSFIMFYILLLFTKKVPRENLKECLKICSLGVLLGLHFLFFFASIKYANVAVGVVCYSLEGFFTAIFEPLIFKKPFSRNNLLCSISAVLGISLIFHIDTRYRLGIILGVISAAMIAFYTIFNKVAGMGKSSKSMLFYELLGGAAFLTVILPLYLIFGGIQFEFPSLSDFTYLFILAFFCTIGLYILHIQVLRTLSAFTVSLYGNFEPVYGILIAVLFLGEGQELSLSFYIGMCLILISVFLQSFMHQIYCKTPQNNL